MDLKRTTTFLDCRKLSGTEEVQMSGAWNVKRQRRYASPTQSGTGEGPIDRNVRLAVGGHLPWVISAPLASRCCHRLSIPVGLNPSPPGSCPEVCVLVAGWVDASHQVSATGSFHGSGLPYNPFPSPFTTSHLSRALSERRAGAWGSPTWVYAAGTACVLSAAAASVRDQGRSQPPMASARERRREASPRSPSDADQTPQRPDRLRGLAAKPSRQSRAERQTICAVRHQAVLEPAPI